MPLLPKRAPRFPIPLRPVHDATGPFCVPESLERRVLLSSVAGRHLFYNASAFDGRNPAANAADDAAIATDKVALRPGGGNSTFANVTSHDKGINGIMVDILGLPRDVSAADFEFRTGKTGEPASWSLASIPLSVSRRAGAGAGASDRVTLLWGDGAIHNGWLQVTVKANANTGLTAPDVFYFGSLVGETGDGTGLARVTSADWRRTRAAAPRLTNIASPFDFNRDSRVNSFDIALARRAVGRSISTLSLSQPDTLGFFVPAQTQGRTPVTLYPVESVSPGAVTRVSFGVPFPKGFLPAADLGRVRLLDAAGAERAVHVSLLTPWRDLTAGADLPSVRSALVQSDVAFPDADADGDADPLVFTLEWGTAARALPAITPLADVRSNWVRYDNAAAPAGTDYKAADNVFEPPAYALFTPQWYGQAVLKTRLLPAGSDPAFAGYDEAYSNFARTAVNDVDPRVTAGNLVHYTTTDEPWLFDRATAFFQLAFRTGDVEYLRQGHRAAQFYANHISPQGYFDLKGDDLKYVTGEAISTDYWLTGDARMIQVHQRMNPMFDHAQNAAYAPGRFWTERHAAAKLMGYVTGYELLGDPAVARKARDTFTTYLAHQNSPPAGAPNTGLLMHLKPDHGEGGSNEWIASPWMTVLLVDAVERYYIHSGDARVPGFVTRIADGVNRIGESMYYTDAVDGVTHLQPYYLAGPGLTDAQREMDEWGDMEHGVDVSKIFALAYFFTKQAGSPSSVYLGRFEELADTGQAGFNYWTRPNSPASGLPAFRLTPARKFNWWFRTTANRDFLLGGDAGASADTQAPRAVVTASALNTAGGTTYPFAITYLDNRTIDVSTIGSGDVAVTGPNGFNQLATLVSVDRSRDGTPRVATYNLNAPGGTWDAADDGTYGITMRLNEVADTVGQCVPVEFLERFDVAIGATSPVAG
jgi:hypothetical protein